jgi:hypothetical protein
MANPARTRQAAMANQRPRVVVMVPRRLNRPIIECQSMNFAEVAGVSGKQCQLLTQGNLARAMYV